MTLSGSDVVIIGGGLAGISAAYYLGLAGVHSTVIERDSVGSHASGFAFGELTPLGGAGIPGPLFPLAMEAMRLHRELAKTLPRETGVETDFKARASFALAFTPEEVEAAQRRLEWQQEQQGFKVEWLDIDEARRIEPRISDAALGAVYTEGNAEVEPYKLVLAMAQAAEKLGAKIRHGSITGIKRERGRVRAVALASGEIPCGAAVIAMGPWSGQASRWLGVDIQIKPLKGQILRLQAPGAPFENSIFWASNYAASKSDGLLWAGTTEEEAGFDERPTSEARDQIMASLLKMLPSLADAKLVQHTACLRPLAPDWLPVLGKIPGWDGLYIATGAGRKGILLCPAMGRVTADLIARGETDIPIDAFRVDRFEK